MSKKLLMGNEAIARGAIEAGLNELERRVAQGDKIPLRPHWRYLLRHYPVGQQLFQKLE